MTQQEFQHEIGDGLRAVVVDVWAPWCGPCKTMHPTFEKLSEEFRDRVRVLSLNADESPDVVRQLRVFAIPTVIGFGTNGTEAARRTGAQREDDLRDFFAALAAGQTVPAVSGRSRLLRLGAAAATAVAGGFVQPAWPFYVAAVALFLFAIHDRCPVIAALKGLLRTERGRMAPGREPN